MIASDSHPNDRQPAGFSRWQSMRFRRRAHRVLVTGIIAFGACLLLFPIFWMLRTSLMPPGQVFIQPIIWIPDPVRFENYTEAVTEIPFWTYARNSFLVAFYRVIGTVFSASLVGFAFARLRAPDKNVLFIILLSTIMLPDEVILIPRYLLFRQLGWLNSFLPLVVPPFFGGGAFLIFLFRQFFMTIPRELDDSAKIDGASYFRIYWDLLLPLSKPAIATVAIFAFFWSWNDFLSPLLYLDSTEMWTLPLGLRVFSGVQIFAQARWHLMMAASLLTMIPPIIVFFSAQRTFVRGMVLTGLKG